ncbi:MAG: TonB-dependent receptor [Bryobacterales bacterium]|nr:TonB-dependent receptor [Bryobacterales bacterium]MBV9398288.1 TonB-dependent receptor [Bryobacterales bacterium]
MRFVTVATLVLAIAAPVFGQGERGTITGTVADPAGAVVASAAVEAKHVETGTVYDTATTNTGNYTLGQLPVGEYEVTVTVPGFKKFTRAGLSVQVAAIVRVDVTLEVGAVSDSVTVNEAATLLKTESGELSHNVQTTTMDSLPILGIGSTIAGSAGIRNPQAVIYLIPGSYVQENASIRVNGAPGNTATYRVEGQDITNGNQITQAQQQPSIDAIQEVTVQTSNFAAEYGQVGGGYLNYSMRSGTNQLHGSAYDYIVNEAFNANTPWSNTKPKARRQDYGFTVGGPVRIPKIYNGHDKTFFFFNWEQYRETQVISNLNLTVPTLAYRAGNFATALTGRPLGNDPLGRPIPEGAIYDPTTQRTAPGGQLIRDQFQGNAIPATRLDPVALAIQNLIPLPASSSLINNLITPFPSVRHTEIPAFKIDHTINAKAKLSYYWHETKTASKYSPQLSGADGLPEPITQAMGTYVTAFVQRANFEYTFTPTLLFHAGVGYLYNNFNDNPVVTDFNPQKTLGLTGVPVNRLFPYITGLCASASTGYYASGCAGTGGMKFMGTIQNRTPLALEKPTGNTSLSWVRGNHTYKAGGEFTVNNNLSTLFTYTGTNLNFSTAETSLPYLQSLTAGGGTPGFAYASFMLGLVDSLRIAPPQNMHVGQHRIGAFVQDSWKITRKLTLDYGLRYDFQTYSKEDASAPWAQFAPNIANPSAGGHPGAVEFEGYGPGRCNCSLAKNYPWAFAPRLGVAYQVLPKTVLRGGVGIVYGSPSDSYGVTAGAYSIPVPVSSPSFGQGVFTMANGIPFAPLPFPNFDVGQFPQPGYATTQAPAFFLDQNAGRPPRQVQYSFGVQREITRDLMIEASYVGNVGVWWIAPQYVNPNAITPDLLAHYGLSLSNPADITLLSSPVNSAVAASRGFDKIPYSGFPVTATVAQALRPFPQFNTIVGAWDPDGKTWYNSLQAKATKRFSHGLDFTALFTWSKQLTTAATSLVNNATAVSDGGAPRNDVFNYHQNKYLSAFDQPLNFTLAPTYTTPALHINKYASWILRDWQVNGLFAYGSGFPILAPLAQNNLNTVLLRANAGTAISFANRVPGVPLFTHDLNCHCFDPNKEFVLNPAAWTQPGPGQWGTSAAYYDDYRSQRRPNENLGLGRAIRFQERYELNLRIEFANIFNRAEMPAPVSTNAAATPQRNAQGVPSAGFGQINTAGIGPATNIQTPTSRQGTVVVRFKF